MYKKHHWQVVGPTFYQLHLLYDKHYKEQSELVDLVAERIQTLGGISIAIALELAREGARVFVNGRTQARVQAAIVNIRHEIYESQVEGIAEDLAALAGAENLLRRLPAKFGWVSEGIVLQKLVT